jgi:hypothetical protein
MIQAIFSMGLKAPYYGWTVIWCVSGQILSLLRRHRHDVDMTLRRVVITVTCVVLAGLCAAFAVVRWEHANRIATVASALAAVAAVGVAVWAALPGTATGPRVSRTGTATAMGLGSCANTGVAGPTTHDAAVATRTGSAEATDGGRANTGVDGGPR